VDLLFAAATPDPDVSRFAATLIFTIMGASLIVWVAIVMRLARREPLMPLWPRQAVPWSWPLALGAFLLYAVVSIATVIVVRAVLGGNPLAVEPRTAQDLMPLLAATAIAGFISTVLTVWMLITLAGATKIDLGVDLRWLKSDLLYGLSGFVAIVPIVFLIKWLLLPLSKENHPLERIVRDHPTPTLLFWTVMVAVVAAPWVEEFLLRVVFQGWLERCFFRGHSSSRQVEFGAVATDVVPLPDDDSMPLRVQEAPALHARPTDVYEANPYLPPPVQEAIRAEPQEQCIPAGWQAAPPIVISSFVFAGMHYGHGIDPFPLFVLALVLGWLYQRTHRLWPCVVLHTALNATSVALLFSSL